MPARRASRWSGRAIKLPKPPRGSVSWLGKSRSYNRSRTGFLKRLSLALISEFSLILAAFGVSLGHIESETAFVITLLAIITITLYTYLTVYAHPLYERVGRWLTMFERQMPHPEVDGTRGTRVADA